MGDNVSLVIPVFNESQTLAKLLATIRAQTVMPSEVIFVDGGSTDNTVILLKEASATDPRFRYIEAGRAMPGKGRNIGAASAVNSWIAFTDAGIRLEPDWLEQLIKKRGEDGSVDIVYGNFSPEVRNLFEKCATIAYVPPLRPGAIRTKSIVTCLLKKEVWEKTGGFPDWRASEDLIFMEKAEKMGFRFVFAPEAMVYWQLRPDLATTYQKFELYSMHNVWAGRQAYWHYGLAKHYALILLAILLSIFHHTLWILYVPLWIGVRTAKRIYLHRYEFGLRQLYNFPVVFVVMVILLVIDTASFSGWVQAAFQRKSQVSRS